VTDYANADDGPYFDLSSFIEHEFLGEHSMVHVIKTISVDTESESQEIEQYDVSKDLNRWKELNWNDVKKYGTYAVDTIQNNTTQKTYYYKSLQRTNPVDEAFISIVDEKVKTVQIISRNNSIISKGRKEYILEKDKGYSMRTCDTLLLQSAACTFLDVTFKG